MHISEIGEKSGLEERKAGRILRLLATSHVFREGVSTPQFTSTLLSDVYPSVGKCFHKQSVEHPTPLDQPIVEYGASLVGFIYFEKSKSMFLTTQLSSDETPKASALLSDVLVDKAWGHSYSPTQTAFNKSTGYPENFFMYFKKVNTLHILFSLGPDQLRMFPEELSSVQDSELA